MSYFARRSAGAGYEGYNRYYSLEYTTNVTAGPWFGVNNQTNILGDNATITYQTTQSDSAAFYRGRLSLQRQ